MEQYRVRTIYGKIPAGRGLEAEVPGSKSITNRALLLATMAGGESRLEGVLFSEDSRYFLDCVRRLGFPAAADERKKTVTVRGYGGRIPVKEASLYVGSAGTAARFLTALLGVSEGVWHLDSSAQMRRRPMAPLLETLRELGAGIVYEGEEGYFPFVLRGTGTPRDAARVNIDSSSQFLSALLIAFGASGRAGRIETEGSHGMAYIDMTTVMMRQFGVTAEKKGAAYEIAGGQRYRPLSYAVEPDVSAACYFYAMAPLLGIRVTVRGVHFGGLQGDLQFLLFLEKMGCRVTDGERGICVTGPADGRFWGVEADMRSCSDQAITLAAIAPFAQTPTTIRGIAHIRRQESDRIAGMAAELTRMGIRCETWEDGIRIYPGRPVPAVIKTYEDHRMAMGFSLTGLRAEGIVIENPLCCKKTFEEYFDVLERSMEELTAGSAGR